MNIGSWMSVGFIDEVHARDGVEVALIWGEDDGGTAKLTVEHRPDHDQGHRQHTIPRSGRCRTPG
jgi:hypothetical protein